EFVFRRLVTPRWPAPDRAGPAPTGSTAPPTIEVRAFMLERAAARFVDRTTAPPFAEQLSDFDVTLTGLTTAPGRRMRFTGSGALGGGTTFKFEGEAAAGERPILELKADLREFPLPRANPYLDRFTAWTATRGTLTASASYHLAGAQLDDRHEVVVRHLEVAQSERRDVVEQRLGMPLGFLVTLLKDARGEIRLSVPVSGDLCTREFDFQEAVWGGIRNLAIRLLALPFSRVGSLFFSEDSKVTAVTLAPVVFEPGTARLGPAMVGHLERVAAFLLEAPARASGAAGRAAGGADPRGRGRPPDRVVGGELDVPGDPQADRALLPGEPRALEDPDRDVAGVRAALPRARDPRHHPRPAGGARPGRGRGQPGGPHLLAVAPLVEPLRALPARVARRRHVPAHRPDVSGGP